MATRIYRHYQPSSGIAVTPSSWSAGWNSTVSGVSYMGGVVPNGTTATQDAFAAGTGVSGNYNANVRHIVGPILSATTISGTVKGQVRCHEVAAGDNYTLALGIKVVQPDGTDRGILLAVTASDNTSATPPEMVAGTSTNRQFQDVSENTSISLSSVDVSAGDYLVIEQGFRQASTSTNAGRIAIGSDPDLADLPEDNTSTSALNGWVEFSATIPLGVEFFDVAENPTDSGGSGALDPTDVTPPATMTAANATGSFLVCMIGQRRGASATLTISEAGGQSWTSEDAIGITNQTERLFWCQFDGTWDANPSVSFGATTCNSVQMLVFRAPTGYTWSINQALAETEDATDPYTNPGQTTTGTSPTVSLVGWFTADDNSWDAPIGAGWVRPAPQHRNIAGSDQSASYAFYIQASGGATGSVAKSQNTVTGDACTTFCISFAATAPAAPATSLLYDRFAAMRPMLVRRVREFFSALIPPKPAHALRFIASALRAANDALFRKAA